MRQFLVSNWYKMMIGTSMLMASFGFLVYSLTPAHARNKTPDSTYQLVPVSSDGTIEVKLPDEQVRQLIPRNEDGSINVNLSEKQLKAIAPKEVQPVDIKFLDGWSPAHYHAYTIDGEEYHALGIVGN